MAKQFLVDIEMSLHQLIDAVLHKSLGVPTSTGSPVVAQIYYDTVTHQDYVYDGIKWGGDADEGMFWMQIGS
jgi:hypothetical protein